MSYKHKYAYSSVCGGLVTIALSIGMLFYLAQQAINIFVNPAFWKTQQCDYKGYHESDQTFSLPTSLYSLAMHLEKESEDFTPSSSLARIQFYYATKKEDEMDVKIEWLNTTSCL